MGIKVFDLQLLAGREHIMGDKPRICIETLETCGKNLYVGTNDCFIHHFAIQESVLQNSNKQAFTVKAQGKKHIGMKKPIVQIQAASALNHLLLNCDNNLVVVSMLDLSIAVAVSGKIRNITKFCLNEKPLSKNPFAVEICVAYSKKRVLQIFQVYIDRVVQMYEVPLPDHPKDFCVDGKFVCFATASAYYMCNYEANHRQELFPIAENGNNSFLVTKVGSSEFLLSASSGLGVFVLPDGTSNRPPLQWSEGVFATCLLQPYVVAVDDEFITVHSLLDQQQKQSLPFQGSILLSYCDIGVVIICTSKDVFLLSPLPLQTQLDALLAEKQVEEARKLLKLSKRKLNNDQFTGMMKRVLCMSGFVRFQDVDFDFDEVLQFFIEGNMDPREIICLFPSVMPRESDFKRAIPPYHEISNVAQMCENDKAQISRCQEFLAAYLKMMCSKLFSENSNNVDSNIAKYAAGLDSYTLSSVAADLFYSTVLLLAVLKKPDELQTFVIQQSKNLYSNGTLDMFISNYVPDLITALVNLGCHHVCALLQFQFDDVDAAMEIWHDIACNKLNDPAFPGLMFVADQLSKSEIEPSVLWKNAEWILKLDQAAGVRIFTSKGLNFDKVQPDNVIDFLHQYPEAVIEYLYYLVMSQKVEKEKYHTHLAVLYLDKVLKLTAKHNDALALETARDTLQDILQQSNLYRIPLILGKAVDAELFEEQVILHSKLGEHEKALSILVHKIGDPKAAKDYCLSKSEGDLLFRRQLFQFLINVYLQDISLNKGASESSTAVIELLNHHPEDFEPDVILRNLPSHWSVSHLLPYLHNTIRAPCHEFRSRVIEQKLLKAELLRLHRERARLHSRPVFLHEGRMCPLCSRPLNNSAFMRYPNGTIVHAHCSRDKHVCPVTGRVFKVKKCSI